MSPIRSVIRRRSWRITALGVVSGLLLIAAAMPACVGVAYDHRDSDGSVDATVDALADRAVVNPCEGVSCGVGTCVTIGQEPDCLCPDGFHAEQLSCVADPPPDPCDSTICGAHAHCDHGVCICDDGYEGNPVVGCTPLSTEDDLCRAELVSTAMAELGYCEGTDSRPYMEYQPGLWCYDFVAWVYEQSSCSPPAPLSLPHRTVGSLPTGWRPSPGDLIKFTIQHYGMVASVSADGQIVTTVEGNVNACVMSRTTTDAAVEYYGTLEGIW